MHFFANNGPFNNVTDIRYSRMNDNEMVRNMKTYQCVLVLFVFIVSGMCYTMHAHAATDNAVIMYKDDEGRAHIYDQSIDITAHYEALQMIEGKFDTKQLQVLRRDSHIQLVETKALTMTPLDSETPAETIALPWHYTMMQQPKDGFFGDGINVAALDTGVLEKEGLEHIERISLVDDPANEDKKMHGTMVATILGSHNTLSPGLIPNSHVTSIKIFDETNEADISTFLEGINLAIEKNAHIINMSLGTAKDFPLLHEAVKAAAKQNILLVASVGNDSGKKAITYPAAYDEVIAVGAINAKKKRASFSNTGASLEFVAPGEKLLGLNHKYYSGTSFAAPYVTSLLASLKQQYPKWSNEQLRDYARNYTEDLGESGRDEQFGYGAISYELQAPEKVATLKKIAVTTSTIRVQYSVAKQATVPVGKYDIYVNGERVATTKATSYTLKKLKANTRYDIAVKPVSTAGIRAKKARTLTVKTPKKTASTAFVEAHQDMLSALMSNLLTADIRNDYATLYSVSDALTDANRQSINTAAKKKKAVVLSKHKTKATFVKTSNLTNMTAKKYSDLTFDTSIQKVASSGYQLKRSGQKVSGYEVKKVGNKTLRLKLPKNAKAGRYAFVLKRDKVKTASDKMLSKHMIVYFDV
jgi:minor extracellular protease Epr